MKSNLKTPHWQLFGQLSDYKCQVAVANVFVALLLSFLGTQSLAALKCDTVFGLASELSLSFGARVQFNAFSSAHLRVLVWNVHKGSDAKLPRDFARISSQSDLVLFQESVSDSQFTQSVFEANKQMAWTQAKSFERRQGGYTGVATGARAKPLEEEVLRSDVFEPLSRTPKTILVSSFQIEGKSESLLVANIHAINFVTNKSFKTHIDQLISKIEKHQGPLLVGGDFNTWNPGRLRYLNESLQALGLTAVETPRKGFLLLDHIYTRGLQVTRAFDLTHIRSSDHTPLLVDFDFL